MTLSSSLSSLSPEAKSRLLAEIHSEADRRKRVLASFPSLHPGQRAVAQSPARFKVLVSGRRYGKTELSGALSTEMCLSGKRIWYCTPTFRLAKQVWRKLRQAFKEHDLANVNNSDLRVDMPNGGFIQMVSLHEPDNLRGEGLDFVIVDEAAYIREGVWDEVLRPMLLTTKGGALFPSSPNGTNWYHKLYLRGHDPTFPAWASWRYPSSDSPFVDEAELEDIRRSTPERAFKQEYLAEFLDDGGAVFRNLKACTLDGEPESTGDVVFGIDLGRHNDYTVIIAIDRNTRNVLAMDRFTDTAWEIQRNRILALVQRFKPGLIVMEENFNDSFVEALMQSGLPVKPFRTTNASKAQVVNNLAMAFEQSDIAIPNDAVLLGELQAFTVERLPAGALRYAAPAGMHDDMVIALALAWHGINNPVTIKVSRYA
jgi:phage terminase large subunit-like protein